MADVTKVNEPEMQNNESGRDGKLHTSYNNSDKVPDKNSDDMNSCSSEESSSSMTYSPLQPSLFNPCGVSASSSLTSSSRNIFCHRQSFGKSPKLSENISVSKPLLLRPSQLSSTGNSNNLDNNTNSCTNTFVLSPPKLSSTYNPFSKSTVPDLELENENTKKDTQATSVPVSSSNTSQSHTVGSSISEKAVSSSTPVRAGSVSFMPLATTGSSTTSNPSGPTTGAAVTGFVFGQNLLERVEVPVAETNRDSTEQPETGVNESNICNDSFTKTNGATSEMLFTSVLQRDLPDKNSDSGGEEKDKEKKSLSEAAREYEESRAVKRKYEEVAVVTGEEEEVNVLQLNCKLFAFDNATSSWMERGRGTLRVNDLLVDSKSQSRVVVRTVGNLRVVLNTKIWAGMSVDRPSEKSVRLTAMDPSGQIRVFLVMAGGKEIDQLYKTLDWRVNNLKKQTSTTNNSAI